MTTFTTTTRPNAKTMLTILGYVLAFDAISVAVAWPIYATPFFLVTAVGAIVAAAVIAWLYVRVPWSWFTTMLVALGTYLVLALPLTSPSSLTNLGDASRGWVGSVSGIVLAWKQLVTIDLPVGTYQSLLVPAFLTFFVLNLVALAVAWKTPKLVWFPVIPMLLSPVFGIAFGYAEVSRQLVIGGVTIPVALGMLGGISTLILAMAFLAWGVRMRRRESLARVAVTPEVDDAGVGFDATRAESSRLGAIRTGRGRAQQVRRAFTAVAVVGVTAIVAGVMISAGGVPGSREVLRSAIDPDVAIRQEVSPLSAYRKYLTDNEIFNAELFTVESTSESPGDVRLAVLPYFNGQIFTVMPNDGSENIGSSFAKVASDLPAPTADGETYESTVTLGQLSTVGNDSIWLPLVNAARSIQFDGQNSRELTDGFYANRATGAGVVIGGNENAPSILTPGATFRVSAYQETGLAEISALSNPVAGTIDEKLIPEKLIEWCASQVGAGLTCYQGMSGAEFGTLISHLRARGYLSHELLEPQSVDGAPVWTTALAAQGYTFAPSLAGHSTQHIDDLFGQLLERQNAVGVDQPDANLVSAAGDDEQFAAATALLASHVGFPSRVVVGFRMTNPDKTNAQSYTIPACDAGSCLGENLAAWVEVQGADGKWAALDVTPQFANPISPLSQGRQDPKNETQVVDQNASAIPPSQSNPSNAGANQDEPIGTLNLAWLWQLLSSILTTLLIIAALLSPFALILGAKRRRRRLRRTASDPTSAVVGAWEELIDELIDAGYAMPRRETRRQLALAYSSAVVLDMASRADEAVFGPQDPKDSSVLESWEIVEFERAERRAGLKLWDRIRLELSLRSFLRYLTPQTDFTVSEVASSLTGSMRNLETGRLAGFVRFVGRETLTLARRSIRWVIKPLTARVTRSSKTSE